MNDTSRDIAVRKITELSAEKVLKLLIFMAGMEAQQTAEEANRDPGTQTG